MVAFEFNGKSFYIDNKLKTQLEEKILPELSKRDKDVVFLVDGKERTGKSKFADILGAFASANLKSPYNLTNMCMTPEEFRNKIQNSNKNDIVIYDEAHRGMGSRRSLSEINNILIDLMMEMGQKNLFVIIVMPTFFMLDRYPALYRARGLFHIYEKKGQRGFWVYFNEKNKQKLFILGKKLFNYNCITWPKFRGRFYNQYAVDEEQYRSKKLKAFNEKPRITKAESYIAQRDKLLYLISKEMNLGSTKVSRLIKQYDLKLARTSVSDILIKVGGEMKEKDGEQDRTDADAEENN
jgi:hypothetical protein